MPHHEEKRDRDDFPPVNLSGLLLPARLRRPAERPDLYKDGKEVLLPLWTEVKAVIPWGYGEDGKPVRWRRVAGVITDSYAVEEPIGGGCAQAWYCVEGEGGGWIVQTRYIHEYALPEEDEPYVPDIESAEAREEEITRGCSRPDPMEDYEPPFYYHPKA